MRVLGGLADGFVIYGLVYAARESVWQSVVVAVIGAVIIQVMLGESATITAKNLFRGLFYRSLAYGVMLLVTLLFTGGSLYSTIFLSRKGSVHAIESVSPTLKAAKNEAELTTIKSEAKTAQNEVKTQISKVEKLIADKQKIVNTYEKHVRNARQSFRRAFNTTRKPQTIQNRMTVAQENINALLAEGFNVWADEDNPSSLKVDSLHEPTLSPNSWRSTVELKDGFPCLKKFELKQKYMAITQKRF